MVKWAGLKAFFGVAKFKIKAVITSRQNSDVNVFFQVIM